MSDSKKYTDWIKKNNINIGDKVIIIRNKELLKNITESFVEQFIGQTGIVSTIEPNFDTCIINDINYKDEKISLNINVGHLKKLEEDPDMSSYCEEALKHYENKNNKYFTIENDDEDTAQSLIKELKANIVTIGNIFFRMNTLTDGKYHDELLESKNNTVELMKKIYLEKILDF